MEVLVVVAIIGVLSSVVMASYNTARQQSRDDVRKADVEQIILMLRLYVEQYGYDIDCDNGLKIDGSTTVDSDGSCPDGSNILSFIDSQMGSVPADPLGPGDGTYYYYFDAYHAVCGNKALVFAHELERVESNKDDVCSDTGADGGLRNGNAWVREAAFVR